MAAASTRLVTLRLRRIFAKWTPASKADVFLEGRLRRSVRQAVTIGRVARAGRARVKAGAPQVAQVDGAALRDLLAEAAAEARLVDIAVNRPHWTTTDVQAGAGEQVTWLAWGLAYVVKPLG